MVTILFDGVAYGMLLFVLACGLSVTLGLMNFVNLAHGAFAMAGGYVAALLTTGFGWSFFWCLPAAFLAAAAIGLVLERTLYQRLYRRSHLDQVLFTIGITFMAVSAVEWAIGPQQQTVVIPAVLKGRIEILGGSIGIYRLFIIAICAVVTVCLQAALSYSRFGAQLRAAVDDPRVARGLGINVNLVFALTFAVGSGLAGLGGALGAEILGMEPVFPIKFMIYFLIVVTVGGTSGLVGAFLAALLLGIADVAGKYYIPEVGAFIIYAVMVAVLIVRPNGLLTRSGAR
ncbi:MAG: branched-chain amino acid ABC transporter permease [Elsteraceae bacterium]